jgi:hypothetical protein
MLLHHLAYPSLVAGVPRADADEAFRALDRINLRPYSCEASTARIRVYVAALLDVPLPKAAWVCGSKLATCADDE